MVYHLRTQWLSWGSLISQRRKKVWFSHLPTDTQMVWPSVFPQPPCPLRSPEVASPEGRWEHLGDSGSLGVFMSWKVMVPCELMSQLFGGFCSVHLFWKLPSRWVLSSQVLALWPHLLLYDWTGVGPLIQSDSLSEELGIGSWVPPNPTPQFS